MRELKLSSNQFQHIQDPKSRIYTAGVIPSRVSIFPLLHPQPTRSRRLSPRSTLAQTVLSAQYIVFFSVDGEILYPGGWCTRTTDSNNAPQRSRSQTLKRIHQNMARRRTRSQPTNLKESAMSNTRHNHTKSRRSKEGRESSHLHDTDTKI